MSLFDAVEEGHRRQAQPLAYRMRPQSLDEFVGQRHFLGEGKLLERLVKADRLGSLVFYGPPGTGKTTLAHLLAKETQCHYQTLSAVSSGVKEVRHVLDEARDRLSAGGQKTLLFIDEIHRFSKAQQDVLLPDVEEGIVTLVGATTENPFFSLTNALVSRSRVFQFEPLSEEEIRELIIRAAQDPDRGLGHREIELKPEALEFLAAASDGDARRALGALEIGVLSTPQDPVRVTREMVAESFQRKAVTYDRDGDQHYDCISALIKSVRGSDVDAAIYWLARMLEGGEEVRFLARRMVILASEDIGNADPHALPLAVATFQACEFVGLPECQLNLAQLVAYLACAPKSNAATRAIAEAREDIQKGRVQPVPVHLRDRHYDGAARLGHGEGYRYAHEDSEGIVAQEYLGIEKTYYRPVPRGFEAELADRLTDIRQKLREPRESQDGSD